MVQQTAPSEKIESNFNRLFRTLKISQTLHACGIRKFCGISVVDVFGLLFSLVFLGKSLNRQLDSERGKSMPGKDTYYRFLNNSRYCWRKVLLMIAARVIGEFQNLTSSKRVKVLILDDSILSRNRSKKAELLARVFDHSKGVFVKGYTLLTLGWSDGFSFVPVDFALLSSANDANRLVGNDENIDKRTSGHKRRKEAVEKKPQVASKLLDNALATGISADYVLMDTWFTNEPMISSVLDKGLHVIGMVKELKQRYTRNGEAYSLSQLRSLFESKLGSEIIGSINVQTKTGIPVKLVFIQNRNNHKEWLAVLSTDISLEAQEIVRIYGMRWDIEVFFKSTKSLLKLGSEFQGQSFDMRISHTTIVFIRYMLLEWERRHHIDDRTLGGLFFFFSDEVRDIDLKSALRSLMQFFMEVKKLISPKKAKDTLCQLNDWIASQPSYIKTLLAELCCEV
ncbi:MAG: IS4 family transposase [Bacillota bacterium]